MEYVASDFDGNNPTKSDKVVSVVRVKKNTEPWNFIGKPLDIPDGDEYSCTTIMMTPRQHLQVIPCMRMSVNIGDD